MMGGDELLLFHRELIDFANHFFQNVQGIGGICLAVSVGICGNFLVRSKIFLHGDQPTFLLCDGIYNLFER